MIGHHGNEDSPMHSYCGRENETVVGLTPSKMSFRLQS